MYDDFDRVVTEKVTLDGSTEKRSCRYDLAGNLTRFEDRNGQVRTYLPDAQNRIIEEKWFTDATAENADTPSYSIATVYDITGLVASVSDYDVSGMTISTLSYAYDELDCCLVPLGPTGESYATPPNGSK